MAIYAVGDIHGNFDCFRRLLERISFDKTSDHLWLTGDIVNRGAQSLAMLRWAKQHEECVTMVLGNHDLYLLAVRAGAAVLRPQDTVQDILTAANGDELCEWLRRRPLAVYADGWLLVHAGVLPQWSARDVMRLAAEAEEVIGGEAWPRFAREMTGDAPARWSESLSGAARIRAIINGLTRLRICTTAGEMRPQFSGAPADIPPSCLAWFDAPQRATAGVKIIFGHWSALGVMMRQNLWALDSGCHWGRFLSAARLCDGALFQEPAVVP